MPYEIIGTNTRLECCMSWKSCAFLYNDYIVKESFEHFDGSIFKDISKTWREAQFKRHIDIEQFAYKIFDDRNYDLTKMMKSLKT